MPRLQFRGADDVGEKQNGKSGLRGWHPPEFYRTKGRCQQRFPRRHFHAFRHAGISAIRANRAFPPVTPAETEKQKIILESSTVLLIEPEQSVPNGLFPTIAKHPLPTTP
jgi:hypothetical protein